MLRINVPQASALISPGMFDEYGIPRPPAGTDAEVNGDVILLFDDEQQAVAYLDDLEDDADEPDDDSAQKDIVNVIISAIESDEFIQTYLNEEDD